MTLASFKSEVIFNYYKFALAVSYDCEDPRSFKSICLKCNSVRPLCRPITCFIFFQACERAESSKSCNLIGSESGRYFTILPANPGGIVGSFIHKFVCCLWMSKNRHFQTIFLLKLALLLALAREKWILLFRQKIWRENQASQPRKRQK